MKILKKTLKFFLYLAIIPLLYLLISLLFTYITVNNNEPIKNPTHQVFIHTNGIHLDIIIPKEYLSEEFLNGIEYNNTDTYFSFGWGDENFYIHTPTWADLTLKNAITALFYNSSTLVHITKYKQPQPDWVIVPLNKEKLATLTQYINESFTQKENQQKILLPNQGYSTNDDFYKANGSYNCFNTCNSWVNNAFKQSNLKACYWTPYDFGLLNKHKKNEE